MISDDAYNESLKYPLFCIATGSPKIIVESEKLLRHSSIEDRIKTSITDNINYVELSNPYLVSMDKFTIPAQDIPLPFQQIVDYHIKKLIKKLNKIANITHLDFQFCHSRSGIIVNVTTYGKN